MCGEGVCAPREEGRAACGALLPLPVADVVDEPHGACAAVYRDASLDVSGLRPILYGEEVSGIYDFEIFHLKAVYGIERVHHMASHLLHGKGV